MTARMTSGSIGPMLNRIYKGCTPYQWVRESYVNSIQAGATLVRFDVEWEAVRELGVHRRVVRDNGSGIARDKVLAFLNKFGGSGKTLAAIEENFGIGVKVTTLPWNHYGIVIVTMHEGELTLAWLHWDEDLQDYGAREFNIGTEDDPEFSALVPLDEFDEYWIDGVDWTKVHDSEENGFNLVLCGMAEDQHTVKGDPNRDESNKYGIVQYLNGRLYEIPEGVEVKVVQYENWGDTTKWPRSAAEVKQGRDPEGLRATLDKAATPTAKYPNRGIEAEGTVEVTGNADMLGCTIQWRLHKESVAARGDIVTVPLAAVRFESHDNVPEVFHLVAKGLDAKAAEQRMSPFVKVAAVRDRLSLVITPDPDPTINVFPDSGRTRLQWETEKSGGQDLPWADWVAAWDRAMPKEIRDAISAYYASLASGDSDLTESDYERLAEKYGSALKDVKRLVPHKSGTITGTAGSTGGTGRRGGGTASRKPGGTRKTSVRKSHDPETGGSTPMRERTVKGSLIHVVCDPGMDAKVWPVTLDEKEGKATVNMNSSSYRRCHDFIMEKYENEKRVPTQAQRDIVSAGVQRAVEVHVALSVTEILTDARTYGEDERAAATNDIAVSNVLKGIRAIEEIASGSIGQRLSGRVKVA